MEKEKDYEVLTEIPYWSNGGGYTSTKRNGLFIFNKKEGTFKRITAVDFNTGSFEPSKDGSKILFTGRTFVSKAELNNHIFEYDMEKDKIEQLTPDSVMSYDDAVYFDEKTVITRGSDMKAFGVNENKKFFKNDIETKQMTCITPDHDMDFGIQSVVMPDMVQEQNTVTKNLRTVFISSVRIKTVLTCIKCQ